MTENHYDLYCLSYNNPERRKEMETIFLDHKIPVHFSEGVPFHNSRIIDREFKDESMKRCWSMCYGHLDMIHDFVEHSSNNIGIFCEDDILLCRDFAEKLPVVFHFFTQKKIDVLLIGYLCENPIDSYCNFPQIDTSDIVSFEEFPYKLLSYPQDTWGAQMYILHKKHAQFILDKYATDYADKTLHDESMIPFNSDWTITKEGTRGLIYPLMVIENGKTQYDNYGQMQARNNCFQFSYSQQNFL